MCLSYCEIFFTKMHHEKHTDTLKLDNHFHEVLFFQPKLVNPQHYVHLSAFVSVTQRLVQLSIVQCQYRKSVAVTAVKTNRL